MLVAFAFLVPVAYVPGLVSTATAGRWAVVAAAGAWALASGKVSMASPAHWLGAAFLAWCWATLQWSVSPLDTAGALLHVLALAAVFCWASQADDLEPVMIAFGVGMAVNFVFAIPQVMGLFPVAQVTGMPGTVDFRNAAGLMLNKSWLAQAGAVTLTWLLANGRRNLSIAEWRVWTLCAGGATAILPLTAGVLVALAVTWLWWAWPTLRARRGTPRACAVMTSAVCAIILACYVRFIVLGVPPGAGEAEHGALQSVNNRLEFWQVLWANVGWLGYGLGTLPELMPQFGRAECDLLELAFETGLVGAALFAGVMAYALGCPVPAARPVKAALVALLLASATSFPLHVPSTAFAAAILAGHLCGRRARASADGSARPLRGAADEDRLRGAQRAAAGGLLTPAGDVAALLARSELALVGGALPAAFQRDRHGARA